MTLEDLVTVLDAVKIYGPLGAWAVIVTYFLVKKDRKLDSVREKHEQAFQSQAASYASVVKVISDDFAEKLNAKDVAHQEQVNELTEKLVDLVSTSVAEVKSVIGQVQVLIAVLTRKGGR